MIVVDDRSRDGTTEMLGELQRKYAFELLRKPGKAGKGLRFAADLLL